HAFGEPRIILHCARGGQQPARHFAGEDQRFEVGAAGVDCRRQAGASGDNNHYFFHRAQSTARFRPFKAQTSSLIKGNAERSKPEVHACGFAEGRAMLIHPMKRLSHMAWIAVVANVILAWPGLAEQSTEALPV